MEKQSDLNKAFRTAITISGAIIATLIIYAVLVEVIKATHKPFLGFVYLDNIVTIRYMFYGLAVIQVIVIRVLRGFLLRKSPSDDEAKLIGKLFKASVLSSALSEMPAICGLVFFLLSGFTRDFYILLFVSLILIFMFFPRYSSWREWLKENVKSNRSASCL